MAYDGNDGILSAPPLSPPMKPMPTIPPCYITSVQKLQRPPFPHIARHLAHCTTLTLKPYGL